MARPLSKEACPPQSPAVGDGPCGGHPLSPVVRAPSRLALREPRRRVGRWLAATYNGREDAGTSAGTGLVYASPGCQLDLSQERGQPTRGKASLRRYARHRPPPGPSAPHRGSDRGSGRLTPSPGGGAMTRCTRGPRRSLSAACSASCHSGRAGRGTRRPRMDSHGSSGATPRLETDPARPLGLAPSTLRPA